MIVKRICNGMKLEIELSVAEVNEIASAAASTPQAWADAKAKFGSVANLVLAQLGKEPL